MPQTSAAPTLATEKAWREQLLDGDLGDVAGRAADVAESDAFDTFGRADLDEAVVAFTDGTGGERGDDVERDDIDVVFALADRITVLDSGRVIATGDPATVRRSAAVQDAYLGGGEDT